MESGSQLRSGFVALCGRPNVGKSTLLNALVGQDVAVATKLPQTTRQRMLGVWEGDGFQAVLVDTPGIHRARSALNKYMVAEAMRGARDVDLILMLAEVPRVRDREQAAAWEPGEGALATLEALGALGTPVVAVLTKCDLLPEKDLLLPIIDCWQRAHSFAAIVSVAALEGRGLDALRDEVVSRLPFGPRYFDDQLSNRDMRWHAGELIRAELFEQLGQELPYSCAVTVARFENREKGDRVRALIHVERESQRGIVIGKGGRTIKAISTRARARIGELGGRPCELFCEVVVTKNWTKDPARLRDLGYVVGEDGEA